MITRGGCEAAPHLNLLPWGEEVRPLVPAQGSPMASPRSAFVLRYSGDAFGRPGTKRRTLRRTTRDPSQTGDGGVQPVRVRGVLAAARRARLHDRAVRRLRPDVPQPAPGGWGSGDHLRHGGLLRRRQRLPRRPAGLSQLPGPGGTPGLRGRRVAASVAGHDSRGGAGRWMQHGDCAGPVAPSGVDTLRRGRFRLRHGIRAAGAGAGRRHRDD